MAAPKGNQFAVDNLGGRPPKLTPKLIKKAREYLPQCVDAYKKIVFDVTTSTSKEKIEKVQHDLTVCLPSVAGLARWLKVSRVTIHNWVNENKVFFNIYQDIMAEQEQRLLDNSLANKYNPTISRLLLMKHGYSEDITSKGEKITNEPTEEIRKLSDKFDEFISRQN